MCKDQARDIEATIRSMADRDRAKAVSRFFKTGPGQYGEGDRIIGVSNPQVRMVVKEAWKATPLNEAEKLVKSPIHEVRLCGLLIMVEKYLKAKKGHKEDEMQEILAAYLSLHPHINNWDLVDLSAIKIVGNHEVQHPDFTLMDEWILPDGHTLWQQRISMVSTWMLTRHRRPEVCLSRAKVLINSPHDLLQKAAGWMLREVWKKGYTDLLREFLEENVGGMSSIMLSYACEQMAPDERKHWQNIRRANRQQNHA